MTPVELPVLRSTAAAPGAEALPDDAWRRTARQARLLSWLSLAWMTVEGVVGLIAGLHAGAVSVVVWASSSFVEGLAAVIVIWRFTGSRTGSAASELRARRLVAGSFLLLVPVFVAESIHRLVVGGDPRPDGLGIAVTASAIALMPALGWAKLRLGARLQSGATAGEGVQNLMCAAQAAAALVALIGASAGLRAIDPIAGLLIAGLAGRESLALWRGDDDCCAPVGFATSPAGACGCGPGCACC